VSKLSSKNNQPFSFKQASLEEKQLTNVQINKKIGRSRDSSFYSPQESKKKSSGLNPAMLTSKGMKKFSGVNVVQEVEVERIEIGMDLLQTSNHL